MAKRGRKVRTFEPAKLRPIYREVYALVADDGMKFTEACREVGKRRDMDWQVVRKRFISYEEHALSVGRMIERVNRALSRN